MSKKNGTSPQKKKPGPPPDREDLLELVRANASPDEVRLNALGLENEQLVIQVRRLQGGLSPAEAAKPPTDDELEDLLDELLDDDSDDEDLHDTPAAIARFERENEALRRQVRELVAAYHASATRL